MALVAQAARTTAAVTGRSAAPGHASRVSGISHEDGRPLTLTVGCSFGFETPQPVSAGLQVAPSRSDVQLRAERWDTGVEHHGYAEPYLQPPRASHDRRGRARLACEAEVVLPSPRDPIARGTSETPIGSLPDEHIT